MVKIKLLPDCIKREPTPVQTITTTYIPYRLQHFTKYIVLPPPNHEQEIAEIIRIANTRVLGVKRDKELKIMRHGKNRYETFLRYGYPDIGIPFEAFADAGFFCREDRNPIDEVECIFCQSKFQNWSSGYDPLQQHIIYSSLCQFVMGYQVNNVPVDGKLSSDPIRGVNRSPFRPLDVID